ncbi:hypothetical protein B0H13DRAFT_1861414 [Mycena leptocephala]|nr:hypothetical protein B0H13DRAFT_1861414 [Mycena leptocephala]
MSFMVKGDSAASEAMAVAAVQTVIDDALPGNTLPKLTGRNDPVVKKMVARVRERRSLIAQTGLDIVHEFFKTKEYTGNPSAIRTYAKYATRFDGPAFWEMPTPESCSPDHKAPGYFKASGYMESPMIIQTAATFLKNTDFIIPEPGPDGKYDFSSMPCGLFAMSANAIERGFEAYAATGIAAPVPKFSKPVVGTAVAAYMKNINRFTLSRWESLLAATGASSTSSAALREAAAMHEGCRDSIYVPSSPPPSD